MNKTEFLSELRRHLRKLPKDEIENAVSFYEEYFFEAGEENEQEVIEKLESPRNAAVKIIGEHTLNNAEEKKGSMKSIGIALLAILASPVALPIAIALIIVILSVIIVFAALIFSIGATAAAFVLYGAVSLIISVILLFGYFTTALFILGSGLFLLSLGVMLIKATIKLSKYFTLSIQKTLGKFLVKRSAV